MFFRSVILTLVILGLTFPVKGQRQKYRIKQVNGVDFILPPYAKIANEGPFSRKTNLSFQINSKYRYQYVVIQGLNNSNYSSAVKAIENARYFFSRDQETELLRINYCRIRSNEVTAYPGCRVFISSNGNCLAVELDYSQLMNNSIQNNFENMALAMLEKMFDLETRYTLPRSICQNIVEKVFELIPAPQIVSLSRYGFIKRDKFSVQLLNPKMQLLADNSSKVTNPLTVGGTLFHLENINPVSFYRDAAGHIKQIPYLSLDRAVFPTNRVATINHRDENSALVPVTYYIVAGSADLELSATISTSKFIALYQPITKSGNISEALGDNDANNCCVTPYDCASQIVLSDDVNSIINPPHQCAGMPIYQNVAVFGERNTIRAHHWISVNNEPISVVLGTTTTQLIEMGRITPATIVQRKYNGHLVRMRANDKDIILLPTDHLITK